MEKNGAISNTTPGCKNNCSCKNNEKQARQLELFPQDEVAANQLDQHLLKEASDLVQKQSCKKSS